MPHIFSAEAAATLQFRHELVHNSRQVAGHRDVTQHEAAAAAGCLERLFQMVRHPRHGAGDGAGIARREQPAVVEKFLARQFGVAAEFRD